jgi:hypothetical protein
MTLREYLASFGEDDTARQAFLDRVAAIGSRKVDVYSASVPKVYDEEKSPLDVDHINAVHYFRGPGASSHYHILLLDYQFAYWSDPERRPVQGWLVAASKAKRDWLKPTLKSDGPPENGPRHVYGSSAYDPELKEFFFPGKRKRQPIEVGDIGDVKNDNFRK